MSAPEPTGTPETPGTPEFADSPDATAIADQAVALDMLLVDGALWPAIRMLPANAAVRLVLEIARHPGGALRRAGELAEELGRIAVGNSELAPGPKDRRFADEAWRSNPVLRRLLQAYLATSTVGTEMVAETDLDWRDRERLGFAMDNLVAALAPSNNPLLNPLGWRAAAQSRGSSALTGVRNLVADLASAPRVPTMVASDAFEVGKDLAVTEGAVVLRTEVFELIQYTPRTAQVRTRPLVIVPPVINKYYIADLRPGRSLIEYLVAQGQQVFVVSWRNPDASHRSWNLDTYGQAILDALDAARRITEADAVIPLGFCSGGILLSMALAALTHRGESDRFAGFALGVCVLDQSRAGTASALIDERTAALAKFASSVRGYLDGRALAEVFAWLRPDDLVWNYWVNNYLQGRQPPAFDILYWNADTTRMATGLHHAFVDMGLANAMATPGGITMLGAPVDLSEVKTDGYVLAGVADHISPWQSCFRSARLFGGDVTFVLSSSGHIASIVNPPTNPKASYRAARTSGDAEEWQDGTTLTKGSWWPDFLAWLGERSGPDKPAPEALGGPGYSVVTAAPGSYVLER
ncbi:MAG: poly[(R)-3-hydroxyalkanoate] polymerase subunit PhaC [Pseudonocardiales bacterium]|nr:poly[(R)-3-hydroxyalkanoate] polymerase subunit PhaC [Pseudonocardiales bacterium]